MRRIVVTDPPGVDAGDAETLGGHGVATVHEALGSAPPASSSTAPRSRA